MLTLMAVALGGLLGLLVALPARYLLRRIELSERRDEAERIAIAAH